MAGVFHLVSYPCREVTWCFPATEMDFALPALSSPQHPVWSDPPFRDKHVCAAAQKCQLGQGPLEINHWWCCRAVFLSVWLFGLMELQRSETENCQVRWKWVSCEIYLLYPSPTWRQEFMVRCSYWWAYGSHLCFKESRKKILLTSLAKAEVEMFLLAKTDTMNFVKQNGTCKVIFNNIMTFLAESYIK